MPTILALLSRISFLLEFNPVAIPGAILIALNQDNGKGLAKVFLLNQHSLDNIFDTPFSIPPY